MKWQMFQKDSPVDWIFLFSVIALVTIGSVMSFSASFYWASTVALDPYYILKKQLIFLPAGFLAMFIAYRMPYQKYVKWIIPSIVVTVVLLLAVLLLGAEIKGAKRWLDFGPFSVQPSEMAKLALILFFSHQLSQFPIGETGSKNAIIRMGALFLVFVGFVMKQPDLGTVLVISGIAYLMLYFAGMPKKVMYVLAGTGVTLVAIAAIFSPYRLKRLFAFLDPTSDILNTNWQPTQGFYALGSGGFFGQGIGQGKQKFLWVSEGHTDYIFSIIGEELGFLGAAIIIVLFFLLLWRGMRIMMSAPDRFSQYLAGGIISMLMGQAILNMAVVARVAPVTGVPLPFLSYGGSSLMVNLVSIGILLSIGRAGYQAKIRKQENTSASL